MPECETFYINIDLIHYIKPYNEGSIVVTHIIKHKDLGISVLESPSEIYALINA